MAAREPPNYDRVVKTKGFLDLCNCIVLPLTSKGLFQHPYFNNEAVSIVYECNWRQYDSYIFAFVLSQRRVWFSRVLNQKWLSLCCQILKSFVSRIWSFQNARTRIKLVRTKLNKAASFATCAYGQKRFSNNHDGRRGRLAFCSTRRATLWLPRIFTISYLIIHLPIQIPVIENSLSELSISDSR